MGGKKGKLEDLKKDLEKKAKPRRRQLTVYGLIGISVIFGTAFVHLNASELLQSGENRDINIEGEIVNVTVDGLEADPFRPVISQEDGVRFTNTADHQLVFEFDRHVNSFSLQPRESRLVDLNMTVYYNVTAPEIEEFRTITAGISVQ